MGRPSKLGLDYFPLDVDIFDDDKLMYVSARFGIKGEIITIKLLTRIYRNGYFLEWDNDAALLFAKRAGDNIAPALVNEVIDELVKRNFFNKNIFDSFSVLTSHGIQKRYIKACQDSKRKNYYIEPTLDLIQLTPEEIRLTREEKGLTPEFSTQSKVKESKVEESKREESKVEETPETSGTYFSNLTSLEKLISLFKSYSRIQNPNEEQHLKPLLKFYNQVYENMKLGEVDECIVDAFKKLNPEKGVRMEFLIDNIQANITSKNEEKLNRIKEIELKEAELLRKEKAKQDLADAKKHDLEKLQQYKLFYETNSKLFTTSEKAELVKFLEAGRIISAGKIIEPKMEEFSLF